MESVKKHQLLLSEAKQAANNLQIGEAFQLYFTDRPN